MALYALGNALIGHWYRTVKAADVDSLEGFYKDLGNMDGFLLLCITGAGKYSIDAFAGHRQTITCGDWRRRSLTSRVPGVGHVIDGLIDSHPNQA
jgi:hypothetical protein